MLVKSDNFYLYSKRIGLVSERDNYSKIYRKCTEYTVYIYVVVGL